MDELKKALENVKGSYDVFVETILEATEKAEGSAQEVLEYIRENPDASSGYVIGFVTDELGLFDDIIEWEDD